MLFADLSQLFTRHEHCAPVCKRQLVARVLLQRQTTVTSTLSSRRYTHVTSCSLHKIKETQDLHVHPLYSSLDNGGVLIAQGPCTRVCREMLVFERGLQCTCRPCRGCTVMRQTWSASTCAAPPICRNNLTSDCHRINNAAWQRKFFQIGEITSYAPTLPASRKENSDRSRAKLVGRMSFARGIPMQVRCPSPKFKVRLTCAANSVTAWFCSDVITFCAISNSLHNGTCMHIIPL